MYSFWRPRRVKPHSRQNKEWRFEEEKFIWRSLSHRRTLEGRDKETKDVDQDPQTVEFNVKVIARDETTVISEKKGTDVMIIVDARHPPGAIAREMITVLSCKVPDLAQTADQDHLMVASHRQSPLVTMKKRPYLCLEENPATSLTCNC